MSRAWGTECIALPTVRHAARSARSARFRSSALYALLLVLVHATVLLTLGFGGGRVSAAEVYHASVSGAACTAKRCACPREFPCSFSPALLARLLPGDLVSLAGGSYAPVSIIGLQGALYAPIIIKGESGDTLPVVFDGNGDAKDVIEIRKSAFVELRGLTVQGAARAGVWVNNSHNISVRDSLIKDNAVWGVFTNHSNDVTVAACRILGPATQHGIYLSNSGDRGLLENNLIRDFDGSGIQLNGDKRMAGADQVIGDGVIEDVLIKGNYISNNGRSGGAAVNLDGARNTRIVGNIVLGNQSAAVAMFRVDGAVATRETQISGNFIVGAVDSRALIVMGSGALDQFVSDNILVGRNPDAALISVIPNVSAQEPKGLFAWAGRKDYVIPATFIANRYSAAGAIAVMPKLETFETLAAWAAIAGDSDSTLLAPPAEELAPLNAAELYRRLGEFVAPQSPLVANPYIGVLRWGQDAGLL